MNNRTLTALSGIKVGHSTHPEALTGCTVILFDKPYPVAYKSYGGGPATYNTEMLRNGKSYFRRHGLFISGGSQTGLTSAASIVEKMVGDGIGFRESNAMLNPGLSGAVVYDLGVTTAQYRPEYGGEAYENATVDPVVNGNVGAGTGTSVGKFQRLDRGMKSGGMKAGVGSARIDLGGGIIVTALSVVNAVGNVVNPDGTILAGNRDEHKKFKTFEDTINFVTSESPNTTISVVGINVDLKTRENYERVAHLATHGQVRAIDPVHTSVDGDTVFVFSTEEMSNALNQYGQQRETPELPFFSVDVIGSTAAKAIQESIYNACHEAHSIDYLGGFGGVIPSAGDYSTFINN